MSFHLAALYKSVPTGSGNTGLVLVSDPALTETTVPVGFSASRPMHVFGAYAGGADLTRARFFTRWRQPNHVRPINGALLPASDPGVANWTSSPLEIPATHPMVLDVNQSGAGSSDIIGLVFLSATRPVPRPRGQALTIRGVVSGASPTTLNWSEVTVVWEAELPPGRYAILGSECRSTNGIAHRWILEGSSERPGGVSQAGPTDLAPEFQLEGTFGVWGKFEAPVMPRLEVLCNAGDASHFVYLQVIPL